VKREKSNTQSSAKNPKRVEAPKRGTSTRGRFSIRLSRGKSGRSEKAKQLEAGKSGVRQRFPRKKDQSVNRKAGMNRSHLEGARLAHIRLRRSCCGLAITPSERGGPRNRGKRLSNKERSESHQIITI